MFAASPRLFILFHGPLPLPHHRPPTLRLSHHHYLPSPISVHLSRSTSHFPIKSSQHFQSRSTSNTPEDNDNVLADAYLAPPSHPWPEWSALLESISISDYVDPSRNIKDEFMPNENLSMEFVDAACCFLGFAHSRPDILGLLSKDDIQMLVSNGAPFLFKNGGETEKRIRTFLQGDESSEATTLDLMKYILSYASNPIFYPERNIKEATELSARNLLREIASINTKGKDDQTTINLEQNVTIKRGDWICQKCNIVNFAKNTKCVECEESRPRRQLTGNEWDCPKCNFYNHGRNTACLKCECRRPGEVRVRLPNDMFAKTLENIKPTNSQPKSIVSETNSETSVTKLPNQINNDVAEESKSEKWFKKVAELHDSPDLTTAISDDDFPDIMPMRKGENRFVVSRKKDRSSDSPTYKRQQAVDQEKSTNFVPFVPFPPDYFAKKDDSQQSTSTNSSQSNRSENRPETTDGPSSRNGSAVKETDPMDQRSISANSSPLSHENRRETTNGNRVKPQVPSSRNGSAVKETDPTHQQSISVNSSPLSNENSIEPGNPSLRNGFQGSSLEGSAVKETDPLDMSEEAKAERWFRRVAQIKDISELSQIPDEDFPSIMPMRKGVNRFVVSKRKTPLERRLASPEYRRTVRTEPSKMDGDD